MKSKAPVDSPEEKINIKRSIIYQTWVHDHQSEMCLSSEK